MNRYPLYITRYVRIIRYWCRLLYTNNIILSSIYKNAVEEHSKGCRNWVGNVKAILNEFGFTNIWIYPGLYDLKHFSYIFKQRLLDCFTQKWHSDLQENRALVLYKHFKVDFSYEPYLNFYPTKFRVALSKLRLSAHSLLIETGRYARSRIDRSERRCTFCDTDDLEDEYHFTLICSRYIEIRRLYLKQYY